MGQSQDVHTWHHLGMWAIVCFVIMHIYFAVRDWRWTLLGVFSATGLLVLGANLRERYRFR